MKRLLIIVGMMATVGWSRPILADRVSPWPGETLDSWHGFTRHQFQLDGCAAWVVEPKQALPGNPWSWCMEFPDAFTERCAATGLLTNGFHHVHIVVGNTFGSPVALRHFDAFYQELQHHGLAGKGALIGLSRGGLYAYRWASRNPEKVSVIYGDAPVCDFKSWPGGKLKSKGSPADWVELQRLYGFATEAEALSFRGNPIDILQPLATAGIPLIHVVGDADDVVPVSENTSVVEDRYHQLGGEIRVIHKPGIGHHPHGLDDPTPVVHFIVEHASTLATHREASASVELTLSSPSDFQVFQRKTRTNGIIRMEGALAIRHGKDEGQPILLQARVRAFPADDAPWIQLPHDSRVSRFRAEIPVSTGGWYAVEVRATSGTDQLGMVTIPHVGVGEVFVVAGQSNSANYGEGRQHPQSDRISAFDGKSWKMAIDPQPGAGGEGGSFIPTLGDLLEARFQVPIGFVSTGVGGTSVREWLPAGRTMSAPPTTGQNCITVGDHLWASSGAIYDSLIQRARMLGTNGFRAILWHQGESDNHQPPGRDIPPSEYQADLRELIRSSRHDLGWEVPWVVAQASYHVPSEPGSQKLRDAQIAVTRDGFAVEGPNTDTLGSEFRENGGQGVHFNSLGLRRHGELWAEKLYPWLTGQLQ